MKFWDFFKIHTHPIEERSDYVVLVVRIPRIQMSEIESIEHLDDRNVTKDFIVGEALHLYIKDRLWLTTETQNHIHINRAEKKELKLKPETFGMKQAKN